MRKLYNVLVVEDSELDKETLQIFLEREGFTNSVTYVDTLVGARQALEDHEYDLILCDIFLPDGDGIDFIEQMHTTYPDMIKIIASGCDNDATIERARIAKVHGFLTKPVTFEVLQAMAEEVENLDIGFGFVGVITRNGKTKKINKLTSIAALIGFLMGSAANGDNLSYFDMSLAHLSEQVFNS